tara:strand:- start:194 stop:796 length:603 start_codon:yes stop_codon:yes gene_type:complete
MKYLFIIFIILFYFFYPVLENLWVEDYVEINSLEDKNTHKTLLNIYGSPLQPCQDNSNDKRGSWDNEGYCSEIGGGVHQICFDINHLTKDFSKHTKQSEWSKERLDKNHCMCLGAWALYKARQDNGEIESTDNELVCESIPEMALNKRYINKWNTWNGHELPKQIKNGIDALYNQCYNKTNDINKKKFLKDKYDKLLESL